MTSPQTIDRSTADRVGPPTSPLAVARRHVAGHFTVDPFGLDAQLADLVAPAVAAVLPVHVSGGEHVPSDGPAAIVSNRGFGLFEPSALGLAVRRATGRRLRVVGASALPFVGAAARRLGALSASEVDVAVALRAGHLVGVPLSPTWLRTGAGMPPHALMPALTHAPIIPAAVVPAGPFGTTLRGWKVHFGSLVTLDEPYDPNDPLVAARFADAVRASIRELLSR